VAGEGQQHCTEDHGDGKTTKRLVHQSSNGERVNEHNISGNVFGVNMNLDFNNFCWMR